jgi:hypothetical protein
MKSLYELFICIFYPRFGNVFAAQEAMRIANWNGVTGNLAESCRWCKGFHVHYGN